MTINVQIQAAFSISVTPHGSGKQAGPDLSSTSEIYSEVGIGRESIAWTPDHRLVYVSRVSGNWDIWLMNKDGSDPRQLAASFAESAWARLPSPV